MENHPENLYNSCKGRADSVHYQCQVLINHVRQNILLPRHITYRKTKLRFKNSLEFRGLIQDGNLGPLSNVR